MRAVVVGGGIGGLAAAVALRRAGVDAVVLEQSRELTAAGYALALAPNALRALDRLGLADAVRDRGARLERVVVRRADGRVLSEARLDALRWEMRGVHRGDLHDVLREAAEEALRAGARCTGLCLHQDGAAAVLADGTEARGDVLVGADGIDSVIRRELHGGGDLRYAGYAAWRALVPFDDVRLHGTLTQSWGPGAQFGLMPIRPGLLYWVAVVAGPPGAPPPGEGAKAALLRRFGGWHAPILPAIEATDEAAIAKTDVYDRDPLARWGGARVTLLGDAAHPMTPNLGQGAAQALEDAVVLANRLRGATDVESALRAYEAARVPRTSALVRRSRQLGAVAQLSSPLAASVRDLVLRAVPPRIHHAQQARALWVDLD